MKQSRRITPLIMCGGTGTRLWPASREGRPKQFLSLFGRTSTFQDTIRRVGDAALFDRPIVVTNAQYRFLVAEQLAELGVAADILLEPARRDSGPAIAAGTVFARRAGADPVVLALAADHVVLDDGGFATACRTAFEAASRGRIVAFGVRPDRPTTEYGYIRPRDGSGPDIFDVERFVEKPDNVTAQRYVAEGYLWNSGNLLFRASTFLEEYAAFEPDSVAAVRAAVDNAGTDLGFVTLAEEPFTRARAVSVDYAVMERTSRAAVVPISYKWSDVGSWGAVWDLSDKDAAGNAAQGPAVFVDSSGCFVASNRALAALFGVEDLVVVASEDALLVARRGSTLDMKQLVQKLRSIAPKVTEDHVNVHRPWGAYQSLDDGPRYQVKRIVVKPGGRLSLQKHMHRAEHWVVVRGAAEVTIGDDKRIVHENESVFIPIGTVHRLANPGKIPLELIEVQTGSYLGEDDIIRLDDGYHRS
jgi:mannose-1-phosphate guanylyltransferase/mannose-6-phosphate isomerase